MPAWLYNNTRRRFLAEEKVESVLVATPLTIGFWRRRIVHPVIAMLRQGVTPEKVALGLALGIIVGVTPMLGSTMILCMAAAFVLKLNPAAIQLVNFLMFPVQLLLLIPFIRAGEWMFGAVRDPLTLNRIRQLIEANVWNAIATLWLETLHALAVWAILGSLAIFPVYRLLLDPLRRLARMRAK